MADGLMATYSSKSNKLGPVPVIVARLPVCLASRWNMGQGVLPRPPPLLTMAWRIVFEPTYTVLSGPMAGEESMGVFVS
jgi:hypothetical protein